MTPLWITGAGAVTAAGLTLAQTSAAVRAAMSGFTELTLADPLGAAQIVARIPSHWHLRRTPADWIVNLAARAIAEALAAAGLATPEGRARTAILLTPPESFRKHPAYEALAPADLLPAVAKAAGGGFHRLSRAFDGGPAAGLGALGHAAELLSSGRAGAVILAGADSLVNPTDLARLRAEGRLLGPDSPKGFVPGEGAAAVCLSLSPPAGPGAAILSAAAAQEADSVLGERYSQGRALLAAMREAAGGDGRAEPQVEFLISTSNGERYVQWEAVLARARFFRSPRETLPLALPAMTVGDTGAAAAALALALLSDAFRNGHAPGRLALVETGSEEGGRAAALVRGQAE